MGQTRQYRTILDAAIEEFSRLGYKATSMQVIANRAGIPKANIHYYFKNKQNLYRQVLNHIIEVWNASFDEIQNDEDPAVALDRMIRAKVMLSYTDANASRLFANEIIHGAEHLGARLGLVPPRGGGPAVHRRRSTPRHGQRVGSSTGGTFSGCTRPIRRYNRRRRAVAGFQPDVTRQ